MSRKIIIFDTTLRDGEQAPGASMTTEQKLDVAHSLAKMKVDVIEAGFPISSEVQFEACKLIAKEVRGPAICALARAVKADIDSAYQALKAAAHPRIHTFIATSDIHMKHKLKKSREEVIKIAVDSVRYAASLVDDVEFSAEDATRSNVDFLCEIVEAVINAGATTVNLPDTVGYTVPAEYIKIISAIRSRVPNIAKAKISVHCHNDLGLATANSLAAIEAGAEQIECTINGVGERAGSAALEEIAMAIAVRGELIGAETNIVTSDIYPISKKVASYTGFLVQPNKAIIGKNAFAHESGIHQDGMLKARETYEIMTPESIGRDSSTLVMGRHTGRHGFSQKVKSLGFNLDKEAIEELYKRFLALADKKKEVYDDDIIALISSGMKIDTGDYVLDYMHVVSGNVIPTAAIRLVKANTPYEEAASGDGPIDALCRAVDKITGLKPTLEGYELHAVTGGKDAVGEVALTIVDGNERFSGRGASTDVIEASIKAYIAAVNKCLASKKK